LTRVEQPTPLEPAPAQLSAGHELFFKREDLHELGAFKWRGALPTLSGYLADGADAVVTASTGNHGAATAWAARRLGLTAIVYVPTGSSETKLALIRGSGAEIRAHGRDLDDAKEEARRFAKTSGIPFFEDGAEPAQYEGYAAIAEEIVDQLGKAPAAVIAPVGNGALIAGLGRGLARRAGATRLFGVAASEAPVMALSFEAGRPVVCDRMGTFADGLAVRVAIPRAVDEMRASVSRMILVSERQIAKAVSDLAAAGLPVEGAGAAALAGFRALETSLPAGAIVCVITGRNIDPAVFARAVSDPSSFPA
jgi:threonine dehydratase